MHATTQAPFFCTTGTIHVHAPYNRLCFMSECGYAIMVPIESLVIVFYSSSIATMAILNSF